MYEIVKNYIPGLPQIAYDGGIGAYAGVIGHATAVYNDTDAGERSYEVDHWKDAFVHIFVDPNQIMQIADENFIAYGACHTGNHKGYVQVELCQTHDHSLFLKSFDMYCYILAYFLYKKKLGVIDNVTLRSHKQITDAYHESDHQDPISYLAEHGKTWADVVSGVIAWYNSLERNDIVDNSTKVAPDWKKVGAQYLKDAGYTSDLHDALETLDIGTFGTIMKNIDVKKAGK